MLIYRIIQIVFTTYTLILLVRVIMSWFSSLHHTKLMHFLQFYTDPYLNFFRRFIPPIGGVIDLSPLIAFIALQIIEKILLSLVGALL